MDSISQHLIGNLEDDNVKNDSNEDCSEELNFGDLLADSYIKLSGYSNKNLRALKLEIEDLIVEKLKVLEEIDKNEEKKERSVYFLKDFSIDKIGNKVVNQQTAIAEGWRVPLYKSEFQNLIGLPFTEDHALADTLRIKKPKQECFNCLSTDHRVTECPVKINNKRIEMHRQEFSTNSMQSQGQMNLFSTRYTSDPDAKLNRGFQPGKLSDLLKEALGCKPNQLPPFIYMMREYGFPEAWLIEAQVSSNKLSVHDGDFQAVNDENKNVLDSSLTDGELKSPEEPKIEIEKEIEILYDANKIYTFIGFNEAPPKDYIDESDKYRVKRYNDMFSRETFLSTLKLEKKKIVKRRSMHQNDSQESEEPTEVKVENSEEMKYATEEENTEKSEESPESPSKRIKTEMNSDHGVSFNEIPGTPIVENMKSVISAPDREKFSENICEHKMYEMGCDTPTGSYQKIVNLTRDFKKEMDAPKYNNDE